MKPSDMDWKRPSLSKQCFNAQSHPKLAASEVADPRAPNKRGHANDCGVVLKDHINRGATSMSSIIFACGSQLYEEELKKQWLARLARRDQKRQEWLQ